MRPFIKQERKRAPSEEVEHLANEYRNCNKCENLCSNRTNIVFGSGSTSPKIVIVGGAPGPIDDEEGTAFVGDEGELFLELLAAAWPNQEDLEDIYEIEEPDDFFYALRQFFDNYIFWTNALLCAPGDRAPTPTEVKNCLPRLHKTILALDPELIIATGKLAAQSVSGLKISVKEKRGRLIDIKIVDENKEVRYAMLTLYDPNNLLKSGDFKLLKKKRGQSYETVEDLKYNLYVLKQYLNLEGERL